MIRVLFVVLVAAIAVPLNLAFGLSASWLIAKHACGSLTSCASLWSSSEWAMKPASFAHICFVSWSHK